MHVLVADDDATTRLLLQRILTRQCQCTVDEAGDGTAVLEALAAGHVDLLLLDLQMPVMDGVETLQVIRASPDLAGIPVVVLSAEKDERVVRQMLGLGITDYLAKPLNPGQIVARLSKVLERVRATSRQQARRSRELGAGCRALVVDGDPDFRDFVMDRLLDRCEVDLADAGTAALRRCLADPPDVLLMGEGIGPLTPDLLLAKLRANHALDGLRAFAIVDGDPLGVHRPGLDGALRRTTDPDDFDRELARVFGSPSTSPGEPGEEAEPQATSEAEAAPAAEPEPPDAADAGPTSAPAA